MADCDCFCVPMPRRIGCTTSYPYSQLKALGQGPHVERNTYPGSVVCSAFPYFAPMAWRFATPTTSMLYVDCPGNLLESNVWKSEIITVNGITYQDTLTITSKSPGGVELTRHYFTHTVPDMPADVVYTNNYSLDTNWRSAPDPSNPANIANPYGVTLTPFGPAVDPDPALVEKYRPFLNLHSASKPTVTCITSISAQDGTTNIMGTRFTAASCKVKLKCELRGPLLVYRGNPGSPSILIEDNSGSPTLADTFEFEEEMNVGIAMPTSAAGDIYSSIYFPASTPMYISAGGYSRTGYAGIYFSDPAPNRKFFIVPGFADTCVRLEFTYHISLRFMVDGFNGTKGYAIGISAELNGNYVNPDTYLFTAPIGSLEQNGSFSQLLPQDTEWPGSGEISANITSATMQIIGRRPSSVEGYVNEAGYFAASIASATVEFQGPV